MCLDFFYKWKHGIDLPKDTNEINLSEINSILNAEFPDAALWLSDSVYKTAPFGEYDRFLRWSNVDKRFYVKEYFDCDDFSFYLMGDIALPGWSALAFGILWTETPTGGHAVNCFVDNDKEVWVVEPQNDKIFKLPSNWNPYLVIM